MDNTQTIGFGLLVIGIIAIMLLPIFLTEPKPKKKKMSTVKLSDILEMVEGIAKANGAALFSAQAHMTQGYGLTFSASIHGIGNVMGKDVDELRTRLLALKRLTFRKEGADYTKVEVPLIPPTTMTVVVKPDIVTEVIVDIYK